MNDQTFQTQPLNKILLEELRQIMSAKPVVFAGSYISSYLPTDLPTGQSFSQALYEYIFGESRYDNPFLFDLYGEIPFEALMENCPDKGKALQVLMDLFNTEQANPVHKLLAEGLKSNEFAALITPNYDLTIDGCLKGSDCVKVVNEKDASSFKEQCKGGAYYKIHGSVEDENSIIYTLSQEGDLQQWQHDLLKDLIEDKVLIFIGYSGRDFDICPLIAFDDLYDRVIWLHFGNLNTMSPYANYLLNSNSKNLVITGDLCEFLQKITGKILKAQPGKTGFDLSVFNFSPAQLLQWRVALLDRLAYPILGKPLLRQYEAQFEPDFYNTMLAGFYGHEGSYKKGYQLCSNMAREKNRPIGARVQSWISAAGFAATYGNYILAWQYSRNAEKLLPLLKAENDNALRLTIWRMQLTFLMTRNQWYTRFKWKKQRLKLLAQAQVIYDKLYDSLIHSGLWTERQVVTHMAERLKLLPKEKPLSLSADLGYYNLGMPSMDIINIKDMVRSNDPVKVAEGLRKIDDSIRKAEMLGVFTEAWKQNRLKVLKQNLSPTEQKRCLQKWWGYLQKPQYFWLLKIVYVGDYLIIRLKIKLHLHLS